MLEWSGLELTEPTEVDWAAQSWVGLDRPALSCAGLNWPNQNCTVG